MIINGGDTARTEYVINIDMEFPETLGAQGIRLDFNSQNDIVIYIYNKFITSIYFIISIHLNQVYNIRLNFIIVLETTN